MMCLPHLPWITAFDDTVKSTYTEESATETGETGSGNAECEATWCSWRTSPVSAQERRVRGHTMCLPHLTRILAVFSTRFVVGPGIVGPDAKATGPRPARHLSVLVGPGMVRVPIPVTRLKTKQRARQHAPHDSSSNEPSGRWVGGFMGELSLWSSVGIWAQGDTQWVQVFSSHPPTP